LRITYVGGFVDLSWQEFEDYFSKLYSAEKFADIQATLIGGEIYQGGGGAEPKYELTASNSEIEDCFKIPSQMIPPANPQRNFTFYNK
jgi:hypothetical protein